MSDARPTDPFNLCQFQYANGHCCGLPAHPKGDGLCLVHYRLAHAKPAPREDDLSAELANPAGDYSTQIDINHMLGKLFDALAANRCSPRRASSLAYVACLLAQTPRLSTRHHFVEGYCRDPSTSSRKSCGSPVGMTQPEKSRPTLAQTARMGHPILPLGAKDRPAEKL